LCAKHDAAFRPNLLAVSLQQRLGRRDRWWFCRSLRCFTRSSDEPDVRKYLDQQVRVARKIDSRKHDNALKERRSRSGLR
jgi:hypothetical protein